MVDTVDLFCIVKFSKILRNLLIVHVNLIKLRVVGILGIDP